MRVSEIHIGHSRVPSFQPCGVLGPDFLCGCSAAALHSAVSGLPPSPHPEPHGALLLVPLKVTLAPHRFGVWKLEPHQDPWLGVQRARGIEGMEQGWGVPSSASLVVINHGDPVSPIQTGSVCSGGGAGDTAVHV